MENWRKRKTAEKKEKKAKTSSSNGFVFSAWTLPPALTGRTDQPEEDIYEPSTAVETTTAKIAASTTTDAKDSWILDNGSDTNVVNYKDDFTKTRNALPGERIGAGLASEQISAYGNVKLLVDGKDGKIPITFTNVAYVPTYRINVISADFLEAKGVYYNSEERVIYRRSDGEVIARLHKYGGLRFFICNPKGASDEDYAFSTQHTTLKPPPPRITTAKKWHETLGHTGKEPLKKLEDATKGARVIEMNDAPSTTNCEPCALAKAKRIVSRRSTHQGETSEPSARVGFDLIPMQRLIDGKEWCSHLHCYSTKYVLLRNHKRKGEAVHILEEMILVIRTRFKKTVVFISTDGEQALGGYYNVLQAKYGFTAEKNASEQNGPNEMSGHVIIQKARTMSIASKIPSIYWPKIVDAAAYIVNRTPTRTIDWKTPFEAVTSVKPTVAHMRVYGCKAYPHKHKGLVPRKQKLDPRAFISYLVGYDSTNIYRVLVPSLQRVLRVRDVTFNEDKTYDHLDPGMGELEETRELVELVEIGPGEAEAEKRNDLFSDWLLTTQIVRTARDGHGKRSVGEKELGKGHSELEKDVSTNTDAQLPTPKSTPATTPAPETQSRQVSTTIEPGIHTQQDSDDIEFEDAVEDNDPPDRQLRETGNTGPRRSEVSAAEDVRNIRTDRRTRAPLRRFGAVTTYTNDVPTGINAFHTAFNSGTTVPPPNRLHRDWLPALPKTWKQAMAGPHAKEWKALADKHITELERKKTWEWIEVRDIKQKDQTLPLKWVFAYKFDPDGYLITFKARICVRGDLQYTEQETYAATLAAKAFRTMMAIAAAWDMDLQQRDAKNAFANTDQPGVVYCHAPEGYSRAAKIIVSRKALFGLKTSPLLWYNDFTNTLEKLGLQRIPGTPCVYHSEEIHCLFFVDDIILAALKQFKQQLDTFDDQLAAHYEMHGTTELEWFLGIRVIRDRKRRMLWLNQASYMESLMTRYGLSKDRCPNTPLVAGVELVPNTGTATQAQIELYSSKVGSINFPATMTRPDVALTGSKLAQFMTNPSAQHMEQADRCIRYMYGTHYYALEYNGSDNQHEAFECASDAPFADDSENRKSTAGWCFKLFGAAVDWRAYK